jgi:hypothetical protein
VKQAVERVLALVAVVLTGAFLAAVAGGEGWIPGGGATAMPDDGYFHSGKTPPASLEDDGCLSKECHPGAPHAKDRTQAAFRNMHARFIDCLVCHGTESRTSWSAHPPPRVPKPGAAQSYGSSGRRWRIAAPTPKIDRGRMHGLIGRAVSCRACHSEQGYDDLARMGIRDLGAGFANPVALRMIEEGAKQWIPDTMR